MVLSKWFQLLDRLIQSAREAKSANSIQLIQAVECLVTVIQAALATNA
jgi:predicted metal-binding protein